MNITQHKIQKYTQKGFTLVETLVYIAVFLLIAGALVVTFLSFDTVLIRNATERVLAEEAKVTLERIIYSIRQADSVNIGQSTFDSSPGVLTLDGDEATRFYVSAGTLMLEIDNNDVGPITSNAVVIEDITFNHQIGTNTDLVRVALTLSSKTKAASTTRTFYSSAVVRGTYE